MKLSQLVAEATARLTDLRARHGADADAEVFVSLKCPSLSSCSTPDERDVFGVELWHQDRGSGVKRYFEIKTEPESE